MERQRLRVGVEATLGKAEVRVADPNGLGAGSLKFKGPSGKAVMACDAGGCKAEASMSLSKVEACAESCTPIPFWRLCAEFCVSRGVSAGAKLSIGPTTGIDVDIGLVGGSVETSIKPGPEQEEAMTIPGFLRVMEALHP